VGLQVVVPVAEAHQVVEGGDPTVGHRVDVVDLEGLPEVAARHAAGLVPFEEGAAQGRRDGASGVGHGGHVDAVGHQDAQDGVHGQLTGHLDRMGPMPGISHRSPSSRWPRTKAS